MRILKIKYAAYIFTLIICLLCFSEQGNSLTVEQAYGAIPHRRTVFDGKTANMPVIDKQYLTKVFELTDLATVERVSMLLWLSSGGHTGNLAENYNQILKSLYEINPPPGLEQFHNLIIDSIEEQKQALFKWKDNSFNYSMIRSESLVRSSSKKLKSAYRILKKKYPAESSYNKRAFFDHLCALDFI